MRDVKHERQFEMTAYNRKSSFNTRDIKSKIAPTPIAQSSAYFNKDITTSGVVLLRILRSTGGKNVIHKIFTTFFASKHESASVAFIKLFSRPMIKTKTYCSLLSISISYAPQFILHVFVGMT